MNEIDWSKVPGGTPEQWKAMTWEERFAACGIPRPSRPVAMAERKAVEKLSQRERNRVLIQERKRNPCLDCGGTFHLEAMEFDHRSDKRFEISQARDVSTVRLLEELGKCDLVCANCHRVRTANRRVHLQVKS